MSKSIKKAAKTSMLFLIFLSFFAAMATLAYLGIHSKTKAAATNCYWVGDTSPAVWNDATHWSSSAGGAGSTCDSGTVPGSDDTVYFTSDNTNDVTIDTNVSVYGINIGSGYTGTIAPSGSETVYVRDNGFTQADGVFNSVSTFTFLPSCCSRHYFTLSGGTFNAPSGNLYIGNSTNGYLVSMVISGTGNFVEGTGTVYFGGNNPTLDVNSTETFYNFYNDPGDVTFSTTIATGDTIEVTNTLTLNRGGLNGGTVNANSNIVQNSVTAQGNTRVNFANDALAQTWTVNGGNGAYLYFDSAADASDSVIFNASGGFGGINITAGFSGTVPMTYNGYDLNVSVSGFTQSAGTFNAPTNMTLIGPCCSSMAVTLSGGIFNAPSGTLYIGNSTNNYQTGMVINGATF
ncbi:MAG: hypothetical protein UT63_C0027G0001, partial [Candidatus Gottesmanbacteria bacterium GW2011_GWC2_39_8]